MSVPALLREAKLEAAISVGTKEVQASPLDTRRRSLLWLLLRFAGEYARAEKQIQALSDDEPDASITASLLRNLTAAEEQRQQVFRTGEGVRVFGEEPAYIHHYLTGLRALATGANEEASRALLAGEAARPRTRMQVDESAATDLRDIDDRLGPFLEIYLQSTYYWVPLERVDAIEMKAARTLFERLFRPAKLHLSGGACMHVLIPVLYPGTSAVSDNLVRLGHMTTWQNGLEGVCVGLGQRMFLLGEEERAFLEISAARRSDSPPLETRG